MRTVVILIALILISVAGITAATQHRSSNPLIEACDSESDKPSRDYYWKPCEDRCDSSSSKPTIASFFSSASLPDALKMILPDTPSKEPCNNLSMVWVDDDYGPGTAGWQKSCFDNIQDGIEAICNGGLVFVFTGTYDETVIIEKPLSLIGINQPQINCPVDGGTAIMVESDNVTVKGFAVSTYYGAAVVVYSSSNVKILDNIVNDTVDQSWDGLILASATNALVANNSIESIYGFGVWLCIGGWGIPTNECILKNNTIGDVNAPANSCGLLVAGWSHNNVFEYNIIVKAKTAFNLMHSLENIYHDNVFHKITRGFCFNKTDDSIIYNHEIRDCHTGFDFSGVGADSFGNLIFSNTVQNCEYYGVDLRYQKSEDNVFYHNNFIDSKWNAYDHNINNVWDNDYPSGGNYWSDYTGKDLDGDGIGDEPYHIPGYGGSVDRYPLMEPHIH
ncbi:MAG: right-handed parallel beta-helix repeat-containing protein [Planctomycetota bacterium]|jgi:nitrous oxidase accessory protein NosD